MAYTTTTGSVGLGIRAETVDAMVKQIAAASYKFKQALAIIPTSSWKNTFFRENPQILAGATGNATKGIPRNAAFPQATVSWQEVSVRIVKYGLEDNIAWEDLLAGDINVQARTVIKLTQGVTKAVDDEIWSSLTSPSGGITSYACQTATNGAWNYSSAAILYDLMNASRLIAEQNYDTSDLMCFVSPADKLNIMHYLASKGAQFPSLATGVAENGVIGTLAGIKLIESNSVAASYALVVKPKTCATWKELVSLRSTVIEDPYKSVKIRCVEEGVLEVTDPMAICLLKNTLGV